MQDYAASGRADPQEARQRAEAGAVDQTESPEPEELVRLFDQRNEDAAARLHRGRERGGGDREAVVLFALRASTSILLPSIKRKRIWRLSMSCFSTGQISARSKWWRVASAFWVGFDGGAGRAVD
jgi:hypothetical protein